MCCYIQVEKSGVNHHNPPSCHQGSRRLSNLMPHGQGYSTCIPFILAMLLLGSSVLETAAASSFMARLTTNDSDHSKFESSAANQAPEPKWRLETMKKPPESNRYNRKLPMSRRIGTRNPDIDPFTLKHEQSFQEPASSKPKNSTRSRSDRQVQWLMIPMESKNAHGVEIPHQHNTPSATTMKRQQQSLLLSDVLEYPTCTRMFCCVLGIGASACCLLNQDLECCKCWEQAEARKKLQEQEFLAAAWKSGEIDNPGGMPSFTWSDQRRSFLGTTEDLGLQQAAPKILGSDRYSVSITPLLGQHQKLLDIPVISSDENRRSWVSSENLASSSVHREPHHKANHQGNIPRESDWKSNSNYPKQQTWVNHNPRHMSQTHTSRVAASDTINSSDAILTSPEDHIREMTSNLEIWRDVVSRMGHDPSPPPWNLELRTPYEINSNPKNAANFGSISEEPHSGQEYSTSNESPSLTSNWQKVSSLSGFHQPDFNLLPEMSTIPKASSFSAQDWAERFPPFDSRRTPVRQVRPMLNVPTTPELAGPAFQDDLHPFGHETTKSSSINQPFSSPKQIFLSTIPGRTANIRDLNVDLIDRKNAARPRQPFYASFPADSDSSNIRFGVGEAFVSDLSHVDEPLVLVPVRRVQRPLPAQGFRQSMPSLAVVPQKHNAFDFIGEENSTGAFKRVYARPSTTTSFSNDGFGKAEYEPRVFSEASKSPHPAVLTVVRRPAGSIHNYPNLAYK